MARQRTQAVITWDYDKKWKYQDKHNIAVCYNPDFIITRVKNLIDFSNKILNENTDMSYLNEYKTPDEWKADALHVLAEANELIKLIKIKE